MRKTLTFVAFLLAAAAISAQQLPVDVILSNGKVITVDDRFSIAQAIAVRGDRIVAVGTTQEIARLAGPNTRRIDLRGRAVVPGIIDNHLHIMRYATTWQYEVRWDGIVSRKEALEKLRARAQRTKPGDWIYILGGWTIDQFNDDAKPFTPQELDRVIPDHPVFLQAAYYEAYLNTRGLQALGIKDRPAGRIATDDPIAGDNFRLLVAKLPQATGAVLEASTIGMARDMNSSGLTAVGSAGCEPQARPTFEKLANEGRLTVRVFCIAGQSAGTPQDVDKAIPIIEQMKLFQGNPFLDHVTFGESVYGPLHDGLRENRPPPPEELVQWRRMATAIAKAGLPLHVHANRADTIEAFLDQIEAIHKEYPVNNLRWVLAHGAQLNASHLERMKKLGMSAAVHVSAMLNGRVNQRVFGDRAAEFSPIATVQNSGIMWGLGSDGTRGNQILPFISLGWAVTGKMVGGAKVSREQISREDALIAYTRKNAYLVLQENNLGSIQPGKFADLLVLDRDYLTVPADQIKDIRPIITMVAGRVVYDAEATPSTR